MAGPALRSYPSLGNVNDSPYSRILQKIDKDARRANLDAVKDDGSDEEDDDTSGSSDESSVDDADDVDEADDVEDETDANDDAPIQLDGLIPPPIPEDVSSKEYTDLVLKQKKDAWMRGGGKDISDNMSTKSATKRKTRQPGLFEALFLPKTYAASQKVVSSRSNASVRPHARRKSATDLPSGKRSKAPSISESSASSPKPSASPSKHKTGSRDSQRFSLNFTVKAAPPPVVKVECVTCLSDDVPKQKSALLECKHRMCHSCLKRIFTLSTTDPQLMPPRCCTENMIPLRHVEKLFDTSFKEVWNRKFAEYTTKHRLYCPTKNCGLWIKPKYIETDRATGRKIGKCKECKTKVCKKCGLKWHRGRDCDNDEATKRVIDLGKEQGWKRCYNCRAMVQLSEGCNHMRCRCNAEFCMVCGQKWKTCDCPWFNFPPEQGVEGFLLPGQEFHVPLGQRVEGLPPPPPPPPGYWQNLPPPPPQPLPPPPPPFRDRRDMPFDPLDPGDIFRSPNLNITRSRRRRTIPAVPLSPQEIEAADEELARRLQNQEIEEAGASVQNEDDEAAARQRRRASRRARLNSWAVVEEPVVEEDVVGRADKYGNN